MPAEPFSISHFVVEIYPGPSARNIREPKPDNSFRTDKVPQTTEGTLTVKASVNPTIEGSVKRGIVKNVEPITWKLDENPAKREPHISASWRFDVRDKKDGFQLLVEQLPSVEFRLSERPRHPVSFIICSYYQRPLLQLTAWRRWNSPGVGWRNFCHETHIGIPVADKPNDDDLRHLSLPITAPAKTEEYSVVAQSDQHDEAPKWFFCTSAECKSFVPRKASPPHGNQDSHGRGPQVY
jgi:hypothetical protein